MSHPYPTARTRNILVLFLVALLFAVPFSGGFVEDPVRAAQASPSDEFASAQPVRAPSPNPSWCQPTWQLVPSPNIGELQSITAVSANDVWVGGDNWHAGAFSHWDGKSWNTVPSPSLHGIHGVSGMDALSANDVWAVSDEAILHWDGAGWNIVNSNNPYAFDLDIEAISTNDVWTVGHYIAHWNGKQRDIFIIPSRSILLGVDAASANDVWAVGFIDSFPGSFAVTMHWDGNTWRSFGMPSSGPRRALFDVAVISANDVWAVGVGGIAHWDGTAWSGYPIPLSGGLHRIAAVSANDIWAVGSDSSTGVSQPLVLHWDGTAWSIVATPIVPGVDLRGVAAVSANYIWILNGPYILHGEPPPPDKPVLVLPRDGVTLSARTALLQWREAHCAAWYNVTVRHGSRVVDQQTHLTATRYTTKPLKRDKTYLWSVEACSVTGCQGTDARRFKVKP